MKKRLPVARIVAAVVGLFFLGVAVYFCLECRRMHRQFQEWVAAEPISIPVDLSKPGTYSGPLVQTCAVSHGEGFYLEIDSDLEPAEIDELLAGLEANIVVTDGQGNEVLSEALPGDRFERFETNRRIMLAMVRPFPEGQYDLTLDVTTGVESLAGVEQTLVAQYHLCGIELYPAMIVGAVALGTFFIGVIIMVALVRSTFFKKGTPKAKQGNPTDE